jgi:hypothetical protein
LQARAIRTNKKETAMRKMALGPILLLVLIGMGCTLQARIYNLSTGEVTPATFTYGGSGRGKISAVLASGEELKGEYITFARAPVNWGSIYADVYGTAGAAYNDGSSQKSNQYGTAVVTGNQGFVADCEYVTTALVHGSGACKGKDGTLYKLIF